MTYIIPIIAGFIVEMAAVAVFFAKNVTSVSPLFYSILFAHLLGSALFSYGMYGIAVRFKLNSPRNWFLLNFTICLAFPAAGCVSFLAILLFLTKRHRERSGVYDEYEKYILYDYKAEEKRLSPDKLSEAVEAELEVSPLVDILSEDDAKLRRGAINLMDKLPKKDAVRLLKISLRDRSAENRFFAASELSRIETEMNDNIVTAKKEVARHPDSEDAHLSLANAYSEYYESGILDEITAGYYLDLAVEEYKKVLDTAGDDIKVLNYLANLEVQRKEYDKALERFKKADELDPGNMYANVGIVQIYFETGMIKEAIKYAKNVIKKMPETKGPMREIIQYWAA